MFVDRKTITMPKGRKIDFWARNVLVLGNVVILGAEDSHVQWCGGRTCDSSIFLTLGHCVTKCGSTIPLRDKVTKCALRRVLDTILYLTVLRKKGNNLKYY